MNMEMTKISKGNKTMEIETFILIHRTTFLKRANKIKEIKRGRKEVCTAKNGLVYNTIY
jgi:hypothetical protein